MAGLQRPDAPLADGNSFFLELKFLKFISQNNTPVLPPHTAGWTELLLPIEQLRYNYSCIVNSVRIEGFFSILRTIWKGWAASL